MLTLRLYQNSMKMYFLKTKSKTKTKNKQTRMASEVPMETTEKIGSKKQSL